MRHLLVPAVLSLLATIPALADDAKPVSAADFAANLHGFEGQRIAVSPCDLSPYAIDGRLACSLVNADGSSLKDPSGLPVAVFFEEASIGQPEKDFMASDCSSYCKRFIEITGTATISQGTDYVLFAEPTFKPL